MARRHGLVIVLAVSCSVGVLSGTGQVKPQELSVSDVLARYVEAAGGAARIAAIRTLVGEGQSNERSPIRRSDRLIVRYLVPHYYQLAQEMPQNFTLGPRVFSVGPKGPWHLGVANLGTPFGAPKGEAPDIQIRRRLFWTQLGTLPSVIASAGLVQFSIETSADASPGIVGLRVSDSLGPFATLYFSTETWLPVRLQESYNVGLMGGAVQTRVIGIEDFRRVAGVLLPFRFADQSGIRTIQLREYRPNVDLSQSLFERPTSPDALARILTFGPPK